jgi:hypothetical protein
MTDERRRVARTEVNSRSSIVLDQRRVPGNLVNVSAHGALFRVESNSNGEVSETDEGSVVSLVIEDGNGPEVKEGVVCRYLEYSSFKYLALSFTYLPDSFFG